ncbi:MAG: peptide chain release factor N(5)-glutamine methyltransferase [Allosphingosinicella sp.]
MIVQAEARTLGELLRTTAGALATAGIELPALEARLLAGHILALTREALLAQSEGPVAVADARAVRSLAVRRERGEPLAYILGRREFWSLPLAVTADVLIPRPDSETVVETALRLLGDVERPLRILDLGTGSGCLLLALLHECRRATGIGVDRSEPALRVARGNAGRLGLAPRCAFVCADWASALAGSFDLIVSNPPYIDEQSFLRLDATVRCYEPALALRGGADGLDAYRSLAKDFSRLAVPGGLIVVETGDGQGESVAGLLAAAGLKTVCAGRDLAGRERCLAVRRE